MSDAIEKYATYIRVTVLQEKVRTLRAELETMEKERDEARRIAKDCRDVVNSWAPPRLASWGVLPWENGG